MPDAQARFAAEAPTTFDQMLAICARDLPSWLITVRQCAPTCPHGKWTAELDEQVDGPQGVAVYEVTGRGLVPVQLGGWNCGTHGETPFEALRAAYGIALERSDDSTNK